MEDLPEFIIAILELLSDLFLDEVKESKKLKTWVKTAIICVVGILVEVLFIACAVSAWQDGDITSRIFTAVLAVVWAVFVIFGAVRGHKCDWKN